MRFALDQPLLFAPFQRALGLVDVPPVILKADARVCGERDDPGGELAVLVEELNKAVPKMRASLDRMSKTLRKTLKENDAFFRERGIR